MASTDFLSVVGDAISTSGGGQHSSSHRHHHRQHHHHHSSRSHSKNHRSRSRSRSRAPSRHRSRSASRHRGTRSGGAGIAEGFFSFGDGESEGEGFISKRGVKSAGLFGLPFIRSGIFGRRRSSSYFKRSPRPGFIHRMVKQLKRLLRDLTHYAKRHPWKVFFLIIVPLFGSLGALLARFGLRIPASIERMLGMASRAGKGDAFGAVNDVVRMAGNCNFGGLKNAHLGDR